MQRPKKVTFAILGSLVNILAGKLVTGHNTIKSRMKFI